MSTLYGLERVIVVEGWELYWSLRLVECKRLVQLDLAEACERIDIDISPLRQLTSLVCSKLTSDDELIHLTNLRELELQSNTELTDRGLSILVNLTKLELGYRYTGFQCKRKITKNALQYLTNLKKLSMTHASDLGLTSEHFSGLTQLVKLRLTAIHLDERDTFRQLTNLKTLKLLDNVNCELELVLSLTSLERLHLKSFQIRGSFDSLTTLTRLSYLRIGYSHGIEVGNGINAMTTLKELSIRGKCSLQDQHISNLENLEILDLAFNSNITGQSLTLLTNLTELNLSQNGLITTEDLLRLPKLRKVVEERRIHYTRT